MVLNIVIGMKKDEYPALLKTLEMFAMQRRVNFGSFRVTIVRIDNTLKVDQRKYPFQIEWMYTHSANQAQIYNACIEKCTDQWIMFMDCGDMMADVYSMNMILDLLPTKELDILYTAYYEECKVDNGQLFVKVIDDADSRIYGKLFRVKFLRDNKIWFDQKINHDIGEIFLASAKNATDYTRFAKVSTKFFPYLHVAGPVEKDVSEGELILRRHDTNMAIMRNTMQKTTGNIYMQAVMMALCTDYYFLHMKRYPNVTKQIEKDAQTLYRENQYMINRMKPDDIEIFLHESGLIVQSLVQYAYTAYGYEMRYDTENDPFDVWVRNGCRFEDVENTNLPKPIKPKRIHKSQSERVAVFCGTRNVYDSMEIAAKSLVYHTPMDRVYFIIEDEEFPHKLPENFICINVADQQWFHPDGKNFKNAWTYMCMMRAAFTKLLPDEHNVLSLDIDVIVNEDISELWDLDLTDYYFAGVPEPDHTRIAGTTYCNFGVIMLNLDMLRKDGKDDEIIKSLNDSRWGCPEQDAFNHFCAGKIYALPNKYNATRAGSITGETDVEKISHYAGLKYWKHYKPFRTYENMTWEEIEMG